jgi:predicted RNase H-like HicB family nuclease
MATSEKSKSSLKRPFPQGIEDEATDLVKQYQYRTWQDDEGHWWAEALEYPNAMGDGKTPDSAIKMARKSALLSVATLMEAGEMPPRPMGDAKRTEQINVRVTPLEKELLRTKARQLGFTGLGDLLRAKAIS